jgi:hypothetical protein
MGSCLQQTDIAGKGSAQVRQSLVLRMTTFVETVRKAKYRNEDQYISHIHNVIIDRLCGHVVRISGYRSRGSGFVSRPYQIS